MVIPCLLVVVDNSSTKASGWVNSSSSNGDSSQMYHEHSKSNWKWSQDLIIINKFYQKLDIPINLSLKLNKIQLKHTKIQTLSESKQRLNKILSLTPKIQTLLRIYINPFEINQKVYHKTKKIQTLLRIYTDPFQIITRFT